MQLLDVCDEDTTERLEELVHPPAVRRDEPDDDMLADLGDVIHL